MQAPIRLAACLVLVASAAGCTHHGLMGMQAGQTVDEAKSAFSPKAGKGHWVGGAGRFVYEAPGGVPVQAVLLADKGKVVGVQLAFQDDALRKAGLNPVTYRFDLAKAQAPDGAKGPFVDEQVKIRAKDGKLFEVVNAGPRFEVGTYDAAGLNAVANTCADAAKVVVPVADALDTTLGADGLGPGPKRDAAIRRLRLEAAAAELVCPKGSGVLTHVGDLLLAIGHANAAKTRYQAALKADADWGDLSASDAHGGLGLVAAKFRHMETAGAQMNLAIQGASTPATKARWARKWADALHHVEDWAGAARYYKVYLDALGTGAGNPADTARVYARLVRSTLETVHGCEAAGAAVEKGLALAGVPDKARGALLASKAFYLLACQPKQKKAAYKVLGQAVKLDPLHAADWAEVTGYYDRESNDAAVLGIMVSQGWLDAKGVRAAKAYQKMERAEVR